MRRLSSSRTGLTVLHVSLSRGSHTAASEGSRQVRVSVWWDVENCNVPSKTNIFRVASAISAAVRATGLRGPMEITAFGDMIQLSRNKQEGLSATGVNLAHVPRNGKNSADRSILANLMYWVSQNPPPAHLFLISGDKDFAGILHKLRMCNYNILLASPEENSPGVLCSAASIVWNWHDLLRGENLAGKCYNQPPDGPYHSWYGRYRAPLLDPFAASEASEEPKPGSETDRPLHLGTPAIVRRRIRKILKLKQPDGIPISDLRNELGKDESFDKENYYGYKRFITFLMSMEDDNLRVRKCSSGQYVAYYISHSNARSESGCDRNFFEDGDAKKTPHSLLEKAKKKDGSIRTTEVSSEEKIVGDAKKGIEVVEEIAEREDLSHHSCDKKIAEPVKAPESGRKLPVVLQLEPSSEPGILRRFWRKWFGSENSGSDTKSFRGGIKSEERDSEKVSIPKTTAGFPSHSSPLGEKASFEPSENFVANLGFTDRIRTWFMNTITSETEKSSDRSSDEERPITMHSMHKLFSQDSFWSIMETFMDTPIGSCLVSESKTRQEMARELRRKGPYCLLSLEECDISRLVDLLIEEKKWVEECPSEAFPFNLSCTKKSSASETHLLREKDQNNLSTLFRSRGKEVKSPENVSRSVGEEEEPLPVRPKLEVLADCQSLVEEIARENPRGIFVGLFRKKFIDRFGYQLDYQKLGYHGLNPLINSMSGVKINSGYIVPDSSWEELGPITDSRTTVESKSAKNEAEFEYEPAVSEDELSEQDETRFVEKKEAEDSSLLRILESWHESKLSDAQKKRKATKKLEEGMATSEDFFDEGMLGFASDFENNSSETTTPRARRKKHGTKKGISFVLEAKESDNERESKLADNALQNLRTSNEASSSSKEKEKVLC